MKKLFFLALIVALLVGTTTVLAGPPTGVPRGRPEGVSSDGPPEWAPRGPPEWASASSPKGASPGQSDKGKSRRNGPAGKSNVAHLYLHEKDPETWLIVEDGGWGKMKYNLSGAEFKFVFNGHGLEPGEDYTLIYYPDPWPGTGLICLGSGTANGGGNVHIKESVDTGDLPAEGDDNYPDGAKIWLVLSNHVNCDDAKMIGWNPTEYLFEYDLITFGDTD